MDGLEDIIRANLMAQRGQIADQKQALNNIPQQQQGLDLTPLAALADSWSNSPNSRLAQAYQGMKPQDNTFKKQALQQQLMQQEQGLTGDEIDLLKLMDQRKRANEKGKELNLTPGEKKRDEDFAKKANEWDATGGFASFAGNLDRLKGSVVELEKDGDLANTVMPKFMRDIFKPESSKTQEDIEFVAQQSLKQILGGQFSKEEGAQLIQRTYNPRLPDEVNVRKLNTLIKQLDVQGRAKQAALDYFKENGTLKGFKGTSATTISDFEKELKEKIMGKSEKSEGKKENKYQDPEFLKWRKANGL
jgi:hypothetical protein